MRRFFVEDRALDDAAAFEFPQLLGEDFVAGFGDEAAEFVEAALFHFECEEDERLPLATNHIDGDAHGAIGDLHAITIAGCSRTKWCVLTRGNWVA